MLDYAFRITHYALRRRLDFRQVEPVGAGLERHGQRDREANRPLHHPADDGGERRELRLRRLEDQLIVHLQDHLRGRRTGSVQHRVDPHHGALDDVGRRPLDHGVGCHSLGGLTQDAIARAQIGQVPTPPGQGLRIAQITCPAPRLVEKGLHTRILLEGDLLSDKIDDCCGIVVEGYVEIVEIELVPV